MAGAKMGQCSLQRVAPQLVCEEKREFDKERCSAEARDEPGARQVGESRFDLGSSVSRRRRFGIGRRCRLLFSPPPSSHLGPLASMTSVAAPNPTGIDLYSR